MRRDTRFSVFKNRLSTTQNMQGSGGGLMDGLRMGEAPEVLNGCARCCCCGSEEVSRSTKEVTRRWRKEGARKSLENTLPQTGLHINA